MAKKEKTIQNFFEKGKKTARSEELPAKTDGIVKNEKKKFAKIILIVIIFALVAGSLGTAGYFYFKYKKAVPGNAAKDEAGSYAAKISRFMALPEGEEPTLATVADREKLKDQPFFADAQNGDKVLIYSKTNEAILYRPSANKIIKVVSLSGNEAGPAQLPNQAESNQTPEQAQPETQAQPVVEVQKTPVQVAIYNGTDIKGLAGKIGEKISSLSSIQIQVTEKTNAKSDYADTLIIDLSGGNGEALEKIKALVGGEIGELPDGEAKPDADILIIGGSDQK